MSVCTSLLVVRPWLSETSHGTKHKVKSALIMLFIALIYQNRNERHFTIRDIAGGQYLALEHLTDTESFLSDMVRKRKKG